MPKLGTSLFLKLLGVFLLTGIAVNVIVGVAFRDAFMRDPGRIIGQRHVSRYLDYVIKDFGMPPDPTRVAEFGRDMGIEVRIERDGEVLFGESLPNARDLREHIMRRGPWSRPVGSVDGRFFLIHRANGLTYAFFTPKDIGLGFRQAAMVLLFVGLSVVLVASYFSIKRLVVPVIKSSIAAKEQLLRDVSHELRSPQTRMRVALELIPESAAKEAIAEDLSEMERMTELILESARFEGGQTNRPMAELDLTAMVRELAHAFRNAPPGIDLSRLPGGLTVIGDPEWMRIAVRNVLDNALKYSRDSGRPVKVSGEKLGDKVKLVVEDFGVGISEGELARVFEPFHRVDRSRQKATGGFGLGLHLTKSALTAQGATISLASEVARGTTVTITARNS